MARVVVVVVVVGDSDVPTFMLPPHLSFPVVMT
jgi:hypothetical protein